MAWQARRFTVVCSLSLLEEYKRVLAYPDVAKLVQPELQRHLFSHLLEDMEMIPLVEIPAVCRDADDDKVIATAIEGAVDYLLTADADLTTKSLRKLFDSHGIKLVTIDEVVAALD